jgi:hypothetical protein
MPSVDAQIGWTAHRALLDRFSEDPGLNAGYATGWTGSAGRSAISGQIDLALHEGPGPAVTNFHAALAPSDARRGLSTAKDPASPTCSSRRGLVDPVAQLAAQGAPHG